MSKIQEGGRRMMVEFVCGRCGVVEYNEYEHSGHYDVNVNMRSNPVPEGWREASGGLPLLCEDCHKALKHFMNECRFTANELEEEK